MFDAIDYAEEDDAVLEHEFDRVPAARPTRLSTAPGSRRHLGIAMRGRSREARCGTRRRRGSKRTGASSGKSPDDPPGEPPPDLARPLRRPFSLAVTSICEHDRCRRALDALGSPNACQTPPQPRRRGALG
jgi:hypothetical protein